MKQKKSKSYRKVPKEGDRILAELLETAADLNRHGLISKEEMDELGALSTTCAAERVARVRIRKVRII